MTESPLATTVNACLRVLAVRPAGLLTDIDGTISAMAPTPTEATVAPLAREALTRLAGHLTLVGAVTGRSAAVAEEMVAISGLAYVGNHGLERRHRDQAWDHPDGLATSHAIRVALGETYADAERAGVADGLVVEDKRLSGTIHYRLSPHPVATRAALLECANDAAERHNLVVTEGRLIVELRPRVAVNKGTAVADLVEEFGLRGLIFLGDDLTDVDAFKAVRQLRDDGRISGLRVGVLAPETQPEVLAESDVTVSGVDACVKLLTALADALDGPSSVSSTPSKEGP